jgi:hypothetical protein
MNRKLKKNDQLSDKLFCKLVKDKKANLDVVIEPIENKITIGTICNPSSEYIDTDVIITIKIYYNVSCVSCGP